jgi:hypothetical protein
VVGAFGVNNYAGAAYVFTRSGGTWDTGALLGIGGAASARFGASVALASDGATAVVGAAGIYSSSSNAGSAYVFTRSGATWSTGTFLGSGSFTGDRFGAAVAMASDGATAVVGAYGANSNAGAAYVFTRSGATWSTGALLGSGSAAGVFFGAAVAVSSDGATAVVGAYGANSNAGAAYVFTRSGTTWSTGALLGSGGAANYQLGYAVAMDGTGASAVVGANLAYANAGAAYAFLKSGAAWSC